VLLMLYGLLGLGMAMKDTHTAEWLARGLVGVAEHFVSPEKLPIVLLWLVFLGAVAVSAERGIAWWALAAPVGVAGILGLGRAEPVGETLAEPARTPRAERPAALNGAIVVVLMLVGFVLLPTWRGGTALEGPAGLLADAPTGITTALIARVGPTDRIWNAQQWGSWLEFALPGVPVAVDSRIEVIPVAAWDDHVALSGGRPDWQAILDRWKVSVVVASRTEQSALIPLMRASPAWSVLHEDTDGVIFVRR